jgi:catechol 2,3-dioxygenase-like lactoylglutathione lyase family enzyme
VSGPVPDYVVVIVEDVDRSVDFYTQVLGLRLAHRAGPYAQLDTGATRVGLYERAAMAATLGRPLRSPDPDAPAFELGFKVDDCDAAYAALVAKGARGVVEPTDRAWGQRTGYVVDPDGHLVELAEDLSGPTSPASVAP